PFVGEWPESGPTRRSSGDRRMRRIAPRLRFSAALATGSKGWIGGNHLYMAEGETRPDRWPRALPALDLHAEYLRGVAPEYRELVIIAEAGRRHDVIDRMVLPRIGVIAAEHDLANAHLRG